MNRGATMKRWALGLAAPLLAETANVFWPLFTSDRSYYAWMALFISGAIAVWAGWVCVLKLDASIFGASVAGAVIWGWSLFCVLLLVIGMRMSTSAEPAFDKGIGMVLIGGLCLVPIAFMFASFGAYLATRLHRAQL